MDTFSSDIIRIFFNFNFMNNANGCIPVIELHIKSDIHVCMLLFLLSQLLFSHFGMSCQMAIINKCMQ